MRFPLLSVVLLSLCAQAAPPKPDELPVQLRDWTRWVLHDDHDAALPVPQRRRRARLRLARAAWS